MYIHIYICICICIHTYIYIYIYTREDADSVARDWRFVAVHVMCDHISISTACVCVCVSQCLRVSARNSLIELRNGMCVHGKG